MYRVKVSYDSLDELGRKRKAREEYLVINALLPSEADKCVSLNMDGYNDFKIGTISESKSEYLKREETFENFYEVVIETTIIDETTAKEKRVKNKMIVPSDSIYDCVCHLEKETLTRFFSDAIILSVKKSAIADVFDVLEKDNNK